MNAKGRIAKMNKRAALANLKQNIAGLQQIADDMQKSIDADECKSLVDSHPENVPTLEEMRKQLRASFDLPEMPDLSIFGH
jgi:tetrahydromethanopterin S-methyltransferase subunit B